MKKEFYRFRRISSLLDEFKELENQSIYFAEPESLNDPMEGYRDVFWSGDYIVWRNLFRHYILCLERLCSLFLISGEDHPITPDDMPIFSGKNEFPTSMYKELFDNISKQFFDNKYIEALITSISKRSTPVRSNELSLYLSTVHQYAIKSIHDEYEKHGLMKSNDIQSNSESPMRELVEKDFIGVIEKALKSNDGDEKVCSVLFSVQKNISDELNLLHRYNDDIDCSKKNKNLIVIEFVEKYISQLEKLVFPNWYTACFMSKCSSSTVWGHYGENHSGVCMVFNSEKINDGEAISLKVRNGYNSSGATYGYVKHLYHSIDYSKGFGQIDFFRMLGRLPISKLNSDWYSFNGEISECADNMITSEDAWRENYWKNFYRDITIKSKDWAYEHEYRLILSGVLDDFSDPKERSLTYDFRSLKGIIFGIKTNINDKIKIIKIIEKKCISSNRDDFKFYQAEYSSEKKCVIYSELSLLKFNKTCNK